MHTHVLASTSPGSARRAIGLVVAFASVALACSGTSSSAGVSTTTQASVAPGFCEGLIDFDSVSDPGPRRRAASSLAARAPGPLEEQATELARRPWHDASSPTARRNLGLIHAWAHGNCGFQRVDVEVRDDNRFRGIPEELHAGPTSFEVLSTAEHDKHEMVLLRRPLDDHTPIYDDLAAWRSGFREVSKLRWVADVSVAPGETGGTTARLMRGDYLVVSLQPDPAQHDEPRYEHGMIAEFTVE